LELRDDLNGAGAVANDGNFLVAEIIACIPCARVHLGPGKGIQTAYGRPFHLVELAAGGDDDVGRVGDGSAGGMVEDLDFPD